MRIRRVAVPFVLRGWLSPSRGPRPAARPSRSRRRPKRRCGPRRCARRRRRPSPAGRAGCSTTRSSTRPWAYGSTSPPRATRARPRRASCRPRRRDLPDLSLAVTVTTADVEIFREEVMPDGSSAVEGLGSVAYQADARADETAGAVVEVGWLSKSKRLMMLRYTDRGQVATKSATALAPKLVALAKQVDAAKPRHLRRRLTARPPARPTRASQGRRGGAERGWERMPRPARMTSGGASEGGVAQRPAGACRASDGGVLGRCYRRLGGDGAVDGGARRRVAAVAAGRALCGAGCGGAQGLAAHATGGEGRRGAAARRIRRRARARRRRALAAPRVMARYGRRRRPRMAKAGARWRPPRSVSGWAS